MRISDWSSDVCSSDLPEPGRRTAAVGQADELGVEQIGFDRVGQAHRARGDFDDLDRGEGGTDFGVCSLAVLERGLVRSEEHTSELQSLMRISYAVFCLKKKKL